MSDYDDRGAYTPPSDRLAFDPRQPVRGGGPAPVTLIVSGLVLIGLVGGVFFLYRDGFRHRDAGPALVGAPVADVRTPAVAPPPAANDAPPAALVVDKADAPSPAPAFAPPPRQPLPPQPMARAAPVMTANAAPASRPVAARSAPPPQVVMLAPEAPPETAPTPPKKVLAAVATSTPHMAAAATATPHVAAAAAPVARPVVRHPVFTIASLTDDALAHRTRPARASRDDQAAPRARLVEAPTPIASLTDDALAHRTRAARTSHDDQAAPKARLAEAPKLIAPPVHHVVVAEHKGAQAAATRPAGGPAAGWVQIGAFSSPTLADQGWRDIASLAPVAMAGKGKAVQPLDRDDGATLYRTYVTGFATVAAAQSFCTALQAAGKSCIVK
jgi:hypothetical protein